MQHQLNLPTHGDGIEAIPAEELATEYPELGYRGRYHTVYLEDYGSTVPDLYCSLYARRHERDTSQRMVIADLSFDEVEELIALLQVAKQAHDLHVRAD